MAEVEMRNPVTELPVADGDGADVADLRVERILEHVETSLAEVDALQASVGAASGDLLLMQYRLRQALDEALLELPGALTALAEVLPVLNTYMKLSQQVSQYVQLSLKMKAAKDAR